VWTVFRIGCLSAGRRSGGGRDAAAGAGRAAVPIAVGVVVLIAGALQFHRVEGTSPYLPAGRHRGAGRTLPADAGTAWRHGLRLGLHCSFCCAGLTAILLVIGVMDLRAMAVVTAAITVERLAPAGEARRASHRRRRRRGRVVPDRASSRARMTHPAWCA